ncbi:MAG: transposase [Candidatus Omnitrophica bacterium]|nr:transposase [Candidatus Omnitrophota bacterium]
MPSYARKHQLNNSLFYHIYNRSNGRVPIFNRKEDFRCFMGLLRRYSQEFGLKIYHWVIMSNHYHLLLELKEPECISKIMAGLGKAYSCYHHKTYSVSGFLWQGRFKLQPVQKERYLTACGRYIERNPMKAGMVSQAYEYPYSSAGFYCLGKADSITTEDPGFLEFGTDLTCRQNAYMKFLLNFDEEEEKSFDNLEQPIGNEEFMVTVQLLEVQFGKITK